MFVKEVQKTTWEGCSQRSSMREVSKSANGEFTEVDASVVVSLVSIFIKKCQGCLCRKNKGNKGKENSCQNTQNNKIPW